MSQLILMLSENTVASVNVSLRRQICTDLELFVIHMALLCFCNQYE